MRLSITTTGSHAQRLMAAAESGIVIAVFARSLYVRDDSGRIACFGGPGLGLGPLNALCTSWPDQPAAVAGATARWQSGLLRLGDGAALDPATASLWQPATPGPWDGKTLARALARLAALPARGLGRMIPALVSETLSARLRGERVRAFGHSRARRVGVAATRARKKTGRAGEVDHDESRSQDHLTLPAADASGPFSLLRVAERDKGDPPDSCLSARLEHTLNDGLLSLARWLRDPRGEPPQAIATLIGLGSGLTPAGDDALGGALVALRTFGCQELADRLASCLVPRARGATSDISFAHLAAAAEGEGAAALHDVLAALARGDEALVDAVTRLDRIGHSSGWDALAGAVAALVPLSNARTPG